MISFRGAVFLIVLVFADICLVQGCWFQFRCKNGQCINFLKVCDHEKDCEDGSDEEGCVNNMAATTKTTEALVTSPHLSRTLGPGDIEFQFSNPDLVSIPTSQITKENQEVVIQCRDEGTTRHKVSWYKDNYGALPKNSRVENGRLTISNIKCEDSGDYVCYPLSRYWSRRIRSKSTVEVENCTSRTDPTTALVPYNSGTERTVTPVNCQNSTINGSCCYTVCSKCEESFTCANGEKIPKKLMCNRKNDCSDGSDEFHCPLRNCSENELQCNDGTCVGKVLWCDGEADCPDLSDEWDCSSQWPPRITLLPKSKVEIDCWDGSHWTNHHPMLELECRFVGDPVPVVTWKKYEGEVPSKCIQSTIGGYGLLRCPDFQQSDQGAYSCVAENSISKSESQPKSMVKCKEIECREGFRVRDSFSIETCLECFCSGKSATCRVIETEMTKHELDFLDARTDLFVDQQGSVSLRQIHSGQERVRYCSVPGTTLSVHSFLKAYGRNLRVPRYGVPAEFMPNAPNIVMSDGRTFLVHSFGKNSLNSSTDVRFWEGVWFHNDKRVASRNDIMKVLSQLNMLLLRCEYLENSEDYQPLGMTLESSRIATSSNSASYVERCSCPTGYDGLSCEFCAPGYVKEFVGDDFECKLKPKECPVGYVGEYCDRCDETDGYYMHRRNGCVKANCSMVGSVGKFPDDDDKCICKERVTGDDCDRCKPGFYFLEAKNPKGCRQCWCNDVSRDCYSSDLFKSVIHSTSLGGYNSSSGRNFWLLPAEFSGNMITAYGGILRYKMKYPPNTPKQPRNLAVEVLSEDDVILRYINSDLDLSTYGEEKTWEVHMEEPHWYDAKDNRVSRGDLLRVLSRIRAIYVESPYVMGPENITLTLVQMDVAEEMSNDVHDSIDFERAVQVEKCVCPRGYEGLSCETCSAGYYKNRTGSSNFKCVRCDCDNCDPERGCQDCRKGEYLDVDSSDSLVCIRCPCNGNEDYCYRDNLGQVVCTCKENFKGIHCEHRVAAPGRTYLKLEISPYKVTNVRIGTSIAFNCSYDSTEDMQIVFRRKFSDHPVNDPVEGDPSQEGIVILENLSRTKLANIEIGYDLEFVECFVFNSRMVEVGRVTAVIEGSVVKYEAPTITNCYDGPKVVDEDEDVELICRVRGTPHPVAQWYVKTDFGIKEVETVGGVHTIVNANLNLNGSIYICSATNVVGDVKCSTYLVVKKKCEVMTIRPNEMTIQEGETANFECRTTSNLPVSWSRIGPVSLRGEDRDGVLTIRNAEMSDTGEYLCLTASGAPDTLLNKTAVLTVSFKREPPKAEIIQPDTDLLAGDSFQIDCIVSGRPTPKVSWSFNNFAMLPSNARVTNDGKSIFFDSVRPANSGFYECAAVSEPSVSTSRIHVRVMEKARIAVEPAVAEALLGTSVSLKCIVLSGYPTPELTWRSTTAYGNYITDGDTLTIEKVIDLSAGKYVCRAENSAGIAETAAEVRVLSPPHVHIVPSGIVRMYVNDSLDLQCTADGIPTPSVQWLATWSRSGSLLQTILPDQGDNLRVRVTPDLHGIVCEATNSVGKSRAEVNVTKELPVLEEEGLSKTVELGSRVELIFDGLGENIKCFRSDGPLLGDECNIRNGLDIPSVQVQHNGVYICKSEYPFKQISYKVVVKGFVPKFSQSHKSYLVLPVATEWRNDLTIEITLKADNTSGLILLKKSDHDFSISLKRGRVSVRLQRSEDNTLESNIELKLEVWYTVIFKLQDEIAKLLIYDNDGELVDNVRQNSNGPIAWAQGLEEVYIGGVSLSDSLFYKFRSKYISFGGCISRLIINGREYHMSRQGVYSKKMSLCRVCTSSLDPCGARGTCFDAPTQLGFACVCDKKEAMCPKGCRGKGCVPENDLCSLINPCGHPQHTCTADGGSLHCDCAPRFSGITCQKEERLEFGLDGLGHVKVPHTYMPRRSLNVPEKISIRFTPDSLDGMLLWQGDNRNFLYIGMDNGKLQYIYYNQRELLKAETGYDLKSGSPHLAVITRSNNTVDIRLDGVSYVAKSNFKTNRVRGDIYIGGISNSSVPLQFNPNLPNMKYGFKGCIKRITFGDSKSVDILSPDVTKYRVLHSCSLNLSGKDSYEGNSGENDEEEF